MCLSWNGEHEVLYSGENSGKINLWNFRDRGLTKPFEVLYQNYGHTKMVNDLLAVPKMEFLFSCSQDRKVILWDMITSTPRRVYDKHTKCVNRLSFNQEYRLLFSAGFDHEVYAWNPYIDSVAFKLEDHNSSLAGVKVIPNSPQIVTADIDGWVKVWDIRKLSCVQTFNLEEHQIGHRFMLSDFIYLENLQRIVFGGKSMAFYDYDRSHFPHLVDDNLPLCAFYSPNSHKILTPIPNRIKVWNAFTGKPENVYAVNQEAEISCVEIDEWEKRVIVGDTLGHTKVYNLKNGALMKQLADHGAEINSLAQSAVMQVIVTGSLDLSILIHQDKELSDTTVLKKIRVQNITNIVKLIHYLDMLVTGSTEGEIQPLDPEQGHKDGNSMVHPGEVFAIQTIPNYSLLISTDSSGEIALWPLHPLPYKYTRIVKLTNIDDDGNQCSVLSTAYDLKEHVLYTGDEKGYIKAFSFKEIIEFLDIPQLSDDGKRNKMLSLIVKTHNTLPEFDEDSVPRLFQVRGHLEMIRHVFFIREPKTLISTGYDRRTRLLDIEKLHFVGALQQGADTVKTFKTQKRMGDNEHLYKWHFQLNVSGLEQEERDELAKLKNAIFLKRGYQDPQSQAQMTSQQFQDAYQLGTQQSQQNVIPLQSQNILAMTTTDITAKYSLKNARSGVVPLDLLIHRSNHRREDMHYQIMDKAQANRRPAQAHKRMLQMKRANVTRSQKFEALPSITQNYKQGEGRLGKKLSVPCIKAATKLAWLLNDPNF